MRETLAFLDRVTDLGVFSLDHINFSQSLLVILKRHHMFHTGLLKTNLAGSDLEVVLLITIRTVLCL